MVLDKITIERLAEEILNAELSKTFVPSISKRYPTFTVEDAYMIQLKLMERKMKMGEKVVGWKAGLTSKIAQQHYGVNEPDFGFITDKMIVQEGEEIILSELGNPSFEGAEIAFLLKDELKGPGVNVAEVLKATEGVLPCIEIISGWLEKGEKFDIRDSIAHNGNAGRFVLGGKITPVQSIDLRLVGAVLEVNGEIVATAAGAAALGNPAHVVAWLANKLSQFGAKLSPGQIIATGTLIGGIQPKPGDTFKVIFDRLGTVTARIKK
ncbi:MAG: fumarylacetoacetate hydrolase family protein [Nitrososphaeria archaeon]